MDNGTSGKLQGLRSCPLRNSRCLVTRLTEAAEILHPPRVPRLVTKPTRTVLHHDGCAQFCSHLSQHSVQAEGDLNNPHMDLNKQPGLVQGAQNNNLSKAFATSCCSLSQACVSLFLSAFLKHELAPWGYSHLELEAIHLPGIRVGSVSNRHVLLRVHEPSPSIAGIESRLEQAMCIAEVEQASEDWRR